MKIDYSDVIIFAAQKGHRLDVPDVRHKVAYIKCKHCDAEYSTTDLGEVREYDPVNSSHSYYFYSPLCGRLRSFR